MNVPTTLNNAVALNQIATIATNSFLGIIIDIGLIIYKKKNWLDPVMLNISYILTNIYNGS